MIRTDDGIKDILSHITPFVNRAVILSDLSEREIYNWMEMMVPEITFHLAKNADRYTNNNTDKLDLVEWIITHLVFVTLLRAKGRGEATLISQSTTRQEIIGERGGGGSFLNRIMSFGRR